MQIAESYVAGDRADGRSGGERQQIVVCVRADELAPGGVSAEASPTGEVVVDAGGTPLDVGRKTRTIPPAIRRALHVRDGGCRFPGCTRRSFLDAHHIEHWSAGGATSRDNLVLLCSFHHTLVHEGGFRVRRDALVGALVFERPDGSAIIPGALGPAPRAAPLATNHRPPKPPPNLRPDYHWAIGALLPRRSSVAAAA